MAVFGMLAFLAVLHFELAAYPRREKEEEIVFPAIAISALAALVSAAFFDALFKVGENGGLAISGSTFYGGLFGGCVCMYGILNHYGDRTRITRKEWFDLLTLPLIVFHIFGRTGCFLAGCCYGIETDGMLGVVFPDNPEAGVYHHGAACYPTQLFEIAALILIAIIVSKATKRFEAYLICYAVARFFIEFFRGDDRGFAVGAFSAAQVISLSILIVAALLHVWQLLHKQSNALGARTEQ